MEHRTLDQHREANTGAKPWEQVKTAYLTDEQLRALQKAAMEKAWELEEAAYPAGEAMKVDLLKEAIELRRLAEYLIWCGIWKGE